MKLIALTFAIITLHRQSDRINQDLYDNSQKLKKMRIPEVLINMDSQRYISALLQADNMKVGDIRRHFKYLMLGVNVVFLALDERRKKRLDYITDKQKFHQKIVSVSILHRDCNLFALWQREKNNFRSYIDQLERLFYVNRIVDMRDDGILV